MSTKGTQLSPLTKWKISEAKREYVLEDFLTAWERYEQKLLDDPKKLPTHVGYCLEVGIAQSTMLEYSARFPEVSSILEHIGDMSEEFCLTQGIAHKINPIFAMFFLKSKRGYKDSPQQLTQNNYMNISPDVLSDALRLMSERNDKASPKAG